MIKIPLIVMFFLYILVASVLAVRGTVYRVRLAVANKRIKELENQVSDLQSVLVK